jgi:hypothetical protein
MRDKRIAQLITAVMTLAVSTLVLAQQTSTRADQDAQAAAGCAVCGGCGAAAIIVILVVLALNIALLVWVARDAKARGMDSAVMWMILVALTGLIGLVIYLFSRPQGDVVQCPNCGNKRLRASTQCPHCGAGPIGAGPAGGPPPDVGPGPAM